MRILYWTALFWPYIGGVEVLGSRFVTAMRDRGHDVVVVTSHGDLDLPDRDEWEGVPIHRFRLHHALARRDLEAVAETRAGIARLKQEFRPQLSHVNLTDGSVLLDLLTERTHSCPRLISFRVSPDAAHAEQGTVLGAALARADWVTANSRAVLADVRTLAPAVSKRSSVVYNGLPRPAVEPAPLPFDPPTILCLGRVVREKGFDVAVEAFARIVRALPDARLLIAGDGPERQRLEQRAHELALGDAVEFRGWVPPEHVPTLLNEATIVAMPSRWREAFGLVALQAAQMGRPVVASAVGGLPEIVVDGETGVLVEKEDVDALAHGILSLLSDLARARALGERARERALTDFRFDAHVDAYESLYAKLAA